MEENIYGFLGGRIHLSNYPSAYVAELSSHIYLSKTAINPIDQFQLYRENIQL